MRPTATSPVEVGDARLEANDAGTEVGIACLPDTESSECVHGDLSPDAFEALTTTPISATR